MDHLSWLLRIFLLFHSGLLFQIASTTVNPHTPPQVSWDAIQAPWSWKSGFRWCQRQTGSHPSCMDGWFWQLINKTVSQTEWLSSIKFFCLNISFLPELRQKAEIPTFSWNGNLKKKKKREKLSVGKRWIKRSSVLEWKRLIKSIWPLKQHQF